MLEILNIKSSAIYFNKIKYKQFSDYKTVDKLFKIEAKLHGCQKSMDNVHR